MKPYRLTQLSALVLCAALLHDAAPVRAADADFYLAGLGLHQETGRNIYLGGIYLERRGERPPDLAEADGARIMEYRVVARRTSMRSMLGGMLLQSELATGRPADKATTDFADALLAAVDASLYAGDSLQIRLTDDGATVAYLNGHELARSNHADVSNYLLMGWVGESGPSTDFRNHITAEQVDPSLLSVLEANTYSSEREAEVAGWFAASATDSEAAQTLDNADSAPLPAAQDEIAATAAAPAAEAAAVTATAVEEDVASTEPVAAEVANPAPELSTPMEPAPVQLASAAPPDAASLLATPESEVRALDVQEYARRLAEFHTPLVGRVYQQIRYPSRAVRRGIEGRLELDVTLTRNGQLADIAVARSSGHDMLDKAAIEAARAALGSGLQSGIDPVAIAEFGDFDSDRLTVPVPISFILTQ